MRLDWNDIRARAAKFAVDWQKAHYERGQSQTFYNEFFEVFGVPRKRVASFEHGGLDIYTMIVLCCSLRSPFLVDLPPTIGQLVCDFAMKTTDCFRTTDCFNRSAANETTAGGWSLTDED